MITTRTCRRNDITHIGRQEEERKILLCPVEVLEMYRANVCKVLLEGLDVPDELGDPVHIGPADVREVRDEHLGDQECQTVKYKPTRDE